MCRGHCRHRRRVDIAVYTVIFTLEWRGVPVHLDLSCFAGLTRPGRVGATWARKADDLLRWHRPGALAAWDWQGMKPHASRRVPVPATPVVGMYPGERSSAPLFRGPTREAYPAYRTFPGPSRRAARCTGCHSEGTRISAVGNGGDRVSRSHEGVVGLCPGWWVRCRLILYTGRVW